VKNGHRDQHHAADASSDSKTPPQRANLTRGGGEPIESPNRDLPAAAFSLSESSSPLAFPPESEVASVAGRTPTAGHHDPSSTPGLSESGLDPYYR
jgi:hypothetical protein